MKEAHAPYTLAIEEEALSREPFILERDGEAVAAVIPITEYQAFRSWREALRREQKRREDLEAFEREQQAFERLKPELLPTYRGQWVAIYQGRKPQQFCVLCVFVVRRSTGLNPLKERSPFGARS